MSGQIDFSIKVTGSLDPQNNKDLVVARNQTDSLLESKDYFCAVSKTTVTDLKVFHQVQHPSFLIQTWGQKKEGLSLFNLFDFTVTKFGRNYLRSMFSHPLNDLQQIKRRTNSVKFLEQVNSKSEVVQQLQQCLKKTGSVSVIANNSSLK